MSEAGITGLGENDLKYGPVDCSPILIYRAKKVDFEFASVSK